MKVHIGADEETGVVHSVAMTSANVHDVTETHRLLHGGETRVWGDAGYQGVDKREENRELDVEWRVAMKPGRRRQLAPESEEALAEKRKASVRAKVEHPFLYVKRHFGYAKVRYRGLAKKHATAGVAAGVYVVKTSGTKRGAFKACNLDANRLRQFSDLPTSVRLDSFASPPVSSPVWRLAVRGTYPPA